jgi:iron(III) transport system substrate-binding protein
MDKNMLYLMRLLAITAALPLVAGAAESRNGSPSTTTAAVSPASGTSDFDQQWKDLLAAAKAEGELSAFICCHVGDTIRPVLKEFERNYGIKVKHSFGSSREQAEKVKAEQAAGRYTLDIWMGGDSTASQTLIPAGILQPLRPMLFHPEVLDEAAWQTDSLPFMDPPNFEHVFAFVGNAQGANIAYNTKLVDPKTSGIRSYWDLLDPKWKGKLAVRDPREAGTSVPTGFMMMNPGLGPKFITRLLSETAPIITLDQREIAEWVALGKVPLCLNCGGQEIQKAKKQGLPIDEWPYLLKEGSYLGHQGGALFAPKNPPNPNAQKFFVNWWLSREGQLAMQKASGFDSLRVDIEKDDVVADQRRKEGVNYAFYQLRPDFQEKLVEARRLSKEALRPGKR